MITLAAAQCEGAHNAWLSTDALAVFFVLAFTALILWWSR